MNTILTKAKVSELNPRAPICVEPDSTVADAIRSMQTHRRGCALVTDAGQLVGVLTERDILRKVVAKDLNSEKAPVADVMSTEPDVLYEDDSAAYALNEMSVGGFRSVTVVDKTGRPCGVLTIEDILDHIIAKMDL